VVVVRAKEIVVATHLIVNRDVHPFHCLHPHRVLVHLKGSQVDYCAMSLLLCQESIIVPCKESIIVPGVDYCAGSRLLCQESIIVPGVDYYVRSPLLCQE
jgi:hypothetical protein